MFHDVIYFVFSVHFLYLEEKFLVMSLFSEKFQFPRLQENSSL